MSHLQTANRREDRRLITGNGRYTADWNLPGQLHVAFLRSDHAHADIVSIDATPALKQRGVVAVFTGADAIAAGYNKFPLMGDFTNRAGQSLIKPDRPVLAHGKVRFVGEAVAMVVAESAIAAHDALEAIEVEYKPLPAVATVEEALAEGAPQLHAQAPGNLSLDWDTGDEAAVNAAFAKAAHVTRIVANTSRVSPSPMELRAYVVSYDAATGCYDMYTPSQGLLVLQGQISKLTGEPIEKLRLHLHDVGGSFGQRGSCYPEQAALMMASKKVGRPVKWIASRSECFMTDSHGRGIRMSGELAMDKEGHFLAARYQFACDMGGYLSPAGPSGHIRNVARCMTGVYRTPALYGAWKVVFTNASPMAAYRGAGRPDIAYLIERLVDKAANEMKIDRAEIRRRNFIPPDAFPYKSMTGGVYEKSDFEGCLDKALAAADWAGFERRREAARRAGKLRGIGMGVVIEGTGAGQFPKDQVSVEFDQQGRLHVYANTVSGGQSHETTFAQVVAETLGIDAQSVYMHGGVLDKGIVGNNTGGSRALVCTGSVCMVAAQKLIEKAQPLAAEALELEPSQVSYQEGVYRSGDGEKSIGLLDLARRHAGRNTHPLNLVAEGNFGITFPNGCHIAEVEIDPETGKAQVVAYTAVDDCGRAINHFIVEGQVHGGITQGAGQIFGEQCVYQSGTGQMLTASFMDYAMPHAGIIRNFSLGEHLVPSKVNPLGAKGVGESGCTASLPTLANATMDALRPLGIEELQMPFTPSKLWHAIQAARKQ